MKRLPWTYGEALGSGGKRVNEQKAIEIIQRVGVTAADDLGDTPLSIAAALGNKNLVNWLLSNGVPVDYVVPGSNRDTALMNACDQKRLECAMILVEAGANLEAANKFGLTPLSITFTNCFADPIPLARCLLEQGAVLTDRVIKLGNEWNEKRFKELIEKNVG